MLRGMSKPARDHASEAPALPQVTPDGLESADQAHNLVEYQELRREIEELSRARNDKREEVSALSRDAEAILASLSPEDRATIQTWVGLRDQLSQTQGALNALKPVAGRLHDLVAMLERERRRRTEMTRVKGELEKLIGRRGNRPRRSESRADGRGGQERRYEDRRLK